VKAHLLAKTMAEGNILAESSYSYCPQADYSNAQASGSSSSRSSDGSCEDGDWTVQTNMDSDSSSDEEGGIFFGQHTEAESRFLAKLSGVSPSPSPPKPKCKRRQSRLVSRLRRDSTEFHRRNTMVFPIQKFDEEDNEEENDLSRMEDSKIQERYQQEVSLLQISPSAFRSPHSSFVTSRRMDKASTARRLTPSPTKFQQPEPEASDSSSESDAALDSGNEESDKENSFMPGEVAGESEGIEEEASMVITMGMSGLDLEFAQTDGEPLRCGTRDSADSRSRPRPWWDEAV
jgi:hypothetical protein